MGIYNKGRLSPSLSLPKRDPLSPAPQNFALLLQGPSAKVIKFMRNRLFCRYSHNDFTLMLALQLTFPFVSFIATSWGIFSEDLYTLIKSFMFYKK